MVLEKLGESLRETLRKIAGASHISPELIKELVRDIIFSIEHFNFEDENNLPDEFENYSIKKIQNSGHWVHAENPKDFITSVLDFLGPRV